jgi:hypothetical protein
MSDWQTVLYWISLVVLWFLIGLNLWSTSRNFRTWKKQKKHLEELEKVYGEYVSLRDTYVKLISNHREENNNETDAL